MHMDQVAKNVALAGAAVMIAMLIGCGGGGETTPSGPSSPNRVITGQVEWPSSLGAITDIQVRLRELRAGVGVAPDAFATGSYSGTSYQVASGTAEQLMVVEIAGKTPQATQVTMGAVVGSAAGRTRADQQQVAVNVTRATTIASQAVQQMLRSGTSVASITPTTVANLELAGAQSATTTSFDDGSSVSAAAGSAITATDNGTHSPSTPPGGDEPVWPMLRGGPFHRGASQFTGSQAGELAWSIPLGVPVIGEPVIGPDGTIYLGAGELYALRADGTVRWKTSTGGKVVPWGGLVVTRDSTVYAGVTTGADAVGLSAVGADGSTKWTVDLGTRSLSAPAISSSGTIYTTGSQGTSWESGAGVLLGVTPSGTVQLRAPLPSRSYSPPAIGQDGTVYVAAEGLCAVTPAGNIKWRTSDYRGSEGGPSIAPDGTVYIGDSLGNLFAVDPADGATRWKFTVSGTHEDIDSCPAIGPDGTIYFGSGDNGVYAIRPDGSLKWKFETGGEVYSAVTVAADGTVYAGSRDNHVYAIHGNTGTLKWRFATGGHIDGGNPVIGPDGKTYVGSEDGKLYAFR